MKKIALFFILFSSITFGQVNVTGTAKYELTINGVVYFAGDGCGDAITGGLQWIAARNETNNFINLAQGSSGYPGNGNGLQNSTFSNSTFFTESNKRNRIEIRTTKREDGTFGCKDTQYTSNGFNISTCFSYYVNFGDLGLNQPGGFTTVVKPIITLTNVDPTNDIIGSESFLNIAPISGINNQFYTWQYSTNNGITWSNLPNMYQQNNFLNIQGSDIPNVNFGSPLAIRVSSGCYGSYSNVLNFMYQKSAPKILTQNTTKTRCYDSFDGTASINFNRQLLLPNEQMSIEIRKEGIIPGVFATVSNIYDPVFDANNNLQLTNLEPGLYQIRILGFYNGDVTYSPYTGSNPYEFTIVKSAPVDFTVSKQDIWCHNGNNGSITINATGEDPSYLFSLDNGTSWTSFSNGNTHTITSLTPNIYNIKVKDARNCIAKNQVLVNGVIQLSTEKVLTQTITQPTAPASITYTYVEPTFFGATNGRIVATVSGGTRFADNTYQFDWLNSAGVSQVATGSFNGTSYVIILDNIPTGNYYLTIKDKNYNSEPVFNAGCTVANSMFFLNQPAKLEVTFQVTKPISCNNDNQFGNDTDLFPSDGQRDESQDGILVATVTGGVQLAPGQNNGLPYFYFWKKQQTNGTWTTLSNADSVLENVSHGNYAFNITDKNGIKLGTYINNVLATEIDSNYFMNQPARLLINFTSTMPSCNPGSNGSANAIVTGGTPPYIYQWSNGETTQNITGLNPNPYFVVVKDARGCTIQGTITINSPNGLGVDPTVTNPTCFEGNNGQIILSPFGGIPFTTVGTQPYTYLWSNGATTKDISGLVEGTYSVTITDQLGCSFSDTYTLVQPPIIPLELGDNRTLCNQQSLNLNVQIQDVNATYNWSSSNGFSANTPAVSITQAGVYSVTITNGVGCQVQDQVTVTTKNLAIDSEFLVSSQAYVNEDIVIVNTSNPFGQNTVWTIPSTATILNQSNDVIVIKFGAVGVQTITLKQTQQDCYAYFSKNINIEERSTLPDPGVTDNPFVTLFNVFPNPSNGNFEVVVKIQEISPIKLRLFPYSGQAALISKSESGKKEYAVNFNTMLTSGTYVLVLETAKQTVVKKIIIL